MALSWARAAARRFLAHVRFALGAALVGAGTGLVIALLFLPPATPGFPAAPALSRWVLALSPAVAIGWWMGLLWGSILTLTGKRTDDEGEGRLMAATLLAAAALVVACAGARLSGLGAHAGLAAGAAAALAVGWWRAARHGSRR